MKKRFLAISMAALLLATAACSGGASKEAAMDYASTEEVYQETAAEDAYYDEYGELAPEAEVPAEASTEMSTENIAGIGESTGLNTTSALDLSQHKIIRSGEIHIMSEAYDETVKLIESTVTSQGGYVEEMQMNGTKPQSFHDGGRSATIVLRIPSASFDKALSELRKGGEVISESIGTENVGAKYRDTQARIESIDVHLESLNNLMAQAIKLEDMLRLEEEISRLRYEKESLESSLRSWDDLVSFSTIHIILDEINTLKPAVEDTVYSDNDLSFAEEASYNFRSAWQGFVSVMKAIALGFVSVWPLLIFVIIVIIIIVICVSRSKKKMKRKIESFTGKIENQSDIIKTSNIALSDQNETKDETDFSEDQKD